MGFKLLHHGPTFYTFLPSYVQIRYNLSASSQANLMRRLCFHQFDRLCSSETLHLKTLFFPNLLTVKSVLELQQNSTYLTETINSTENISELRPWLSYFRRFTSKAVGYRLSERGRGPRHANMTEAQLRPHKDQCCLPHLNQKPLGSLCPKVLQSQVKPPLGIWYMERVPGGRPRVTKAGEVNSGHYLECHSSKRTCHLHVLACWCSENIWTRCLLFIKLNRKNINGAWLNFL